MGRPRLNLTGKTFGKLKVVGPNGITSSGHTLWDCICECEAWLITRGSELTSSGTASCRSCAKLKDITGKKYNRLTAIRRVGKNSNGMSKWLCRCDCGNETIVAINHLTTKHTKSCGRCPINTFRKKDDYCEGLTAKKELFLFDKADWDIVTAYNWRVDAKGYVTTSFQGKVVKLHRLLMQPPKGIQVDHINRIKTDCRRTNMRLALNRENSANKTVFSNNFSTGHKNVYAVGDLFRVIVWKAGKAHNFGYHSDLHGAIKVANKARRQLFGAFAYYEDINGGIK